MAEITSILLRIFGDNFSFVIITTASIRSLVQNFQLICYSQRVNATSQYSDSGNSRCSKWPNERMVAVVNIAGLLYKKEEAAEKDDFKTTTEYVFRKILACSVSHRMIVTA